VKGERRRREILSLLEFGGLTTTELAAELEMTREGVLYQMHILERIDGVEREKDGYSITWRKVRARQEDYANY